jgi:hypothetical protein
MKKLLTVITLALLIVCSPDAFAQEFPPVDKSPLDIAYYPTRAAFRAFAKTEEEKAALQPVMKVTYSRPMKNDRNIFGELIKYGEVWRLGANESTELFLYQDVTLSGTKLEAGRYTIYAVPNEKEWEVHVSSDLDNWGAYAFKPAESTIVKLTVPTEQTEETLEAFSIVFEKIDDNTVHMIMGWDDTMVRVPFDL